MKQFFLRPSRENRLLTLLFILFGAVCVVVILSNTPYHDTLYYWDWGRHLSLSYYDGPPMVAYFLRGFTLFLGHAPWVFTLLSVITDVVMAILIYALVWYLFVDVVTLTIKQKKNIALLAGASWLFLPAAFLQYVPLFEYDTPTSLFWIATILCFYLAHKKHNTGYLYLTGIFAGCLLLSKYTGVLLYVALFILICSVKPYRYLLRNIHLYGACILSLLVFSPVLIWNTQHGFASFYYQAQHGFAHVWSWSNLGSYFLATLINYNVIFLLLLYFIVRHFKSLIKDEQLALLFYPALVSLLFFAMAAPYSYKYNWNETFVITAVILVSYFVVAFHVFKNLLLLALSFYMISLIIMALFLATQGKIFGTALVNRLSALNWKRNALIVNKIYDGQVPVFADTWYLAAVLAYYLKGQPFIYSWFWQGNEYAYWSQAMIKKIKEGEVPKLIYVTADGIPFPTFMKCQWSLKASYGKHPLQVYTCMRTN